MSDYYSSAQFYKDSIEVMQRDSERMKRMGFIPEDEIASAKAKLKEMSKRNKEQS